MTTKTPKNEVLRSLISSRALAPILLALVSGGCAGPALDEADGLGEVGEVEQAAAAAVRRWPMPFGGNLIYYYIDADGDAADVVGNQLGCNEAVDGAPLPSAGDPDAIREGLARYEAQTPIEFEELDFLPTFWLGFPVMVFTRGTYSTAHADRIPDNTSGDWAGCVYLPEEDDGSTVKVRTVQHEVGHNLGLIHEQKRWDRNDHIVYDDECVDDDEEVRYERVPEADSSYMGPYDLDSIMHYQSSKSSDPPNPDPAPAGCPYTLLEKTCTAGTTDCDNYHASTGCPASEPNCRKIALSDDFSDGDRIAFYRMYEPVLGSSEANDEFGAAMVSADFDQDGYADLAVGAPGEAPYSDPATGAVFLYKGTEVGLVAWKMLRPAQFTAALGDGAEFGAAMAAGDVDDDGYPDLVVGAPGFTVNGAADAGAIFLYLSGRNGPVAATNGDFTQGDSGVSADEAGDRFGAAVEIAKLASGERRIAVGAPGEVYNGKSSGYVTILAIYGDSFIYQAQGLHPGQFAGTVNNGDRFGTALAATDWDGDGISDLAVGAPQNSVPGKGGAVFLYKGGSSLTTMQKLDDASPEAGARFGEALAVGAFRGDTWNSGNKKRQLVVGAPRKYTSRGKAYVYRTTVSGSSFTLGNREVLDESMISGMAIEDHDRFGEVFAVADFDDDGDDDLAVGVPHEDLSEVDMGAVAFFRGHPGAALTGWGYRTQSADQWANMYNDYYGSALAAGLFGDRLNDVTAANDDLPDLAVGVSGKASPAAYGGSMQVLMGDGSIPQYRQSFSQATSTPE